MSQLLMAPPHSHAKSALQKTTDGGLDLVEELGRRVQGEVRFDRYTRMLYSTDASLYQITPIGVVIPANVDDVQATVEIATRYGAPVLPRGSGSSLAGHYYAYIKSFENGKWYEFNDSTVVPVSDRAIEDSFGSDMSTASWQSSANAYMLMCAGCGVLVIAV